MRMIRFKSVSTNIKLKLQDLLAVMMDKPAS